MLKSIDGGIIRGLFGLDTFKETRGYAYHGEYTIARTGCQPSTTPICCSLSAMQCSLLKVAGLDPSNAFSMNLRLTAIELVGTRLAWPLLSWVGRRPAYLVGCSVLCLL